MKRLYIIAVCMFFPMAFYAQGGTQPVKQSTGINPGAQQTAPAETAKEAPKVMRMSASKDSLPLQPVPASVIKNEPVTIQPKQMSFEIGTGPR